MVYFSQRRGDYDKRFLDICTSREGAKALFFTGKAQKFGIANRSTMFFTTNSVSPSKGEDNFFIYFKEPSISRLSSLKCSG